MSFFSRREIDPVCGMAVDPKTALSSKSSDGKPAYFCSERCLAEFNRQPSRGAPGHRPHGCCG